MPSQHSLEKKHNIFQLQAISRAHFTVAQDKAIQCRGAISQVRNNHWLYFPPIFYVTSYQIWHFYARKSILSLPPFRWTEFAITNGVLSHLNVEGARLSTIVYFNVDVILAASAVVVVVLYLLGRVAKFILVGPAHKRTVKAKKQW